MCKRCQIYIIGLKKTCLGVLDRGERDKNTETGLKEGVVVEISTTVLPFAMLAPSLKYSPSSPETYRRNSSRRS